MTNLTDLEISKALALAIGWSDATVCSVSAQCYITTPNGIDKFKPKEGWPFWVRGRVFDYRDWNVIGPIAEKFDCFPRWNGASWESVGLTDYVYANTPQKAIALAVIQGAKK